jgi:predicted nucleic acid-binding protein
MILLDTNVVSELMRPKCNLVVEQWIDAQIAETLFLSAISLSELLAGIEIMPEGRRRHSLRKLLEEVVTRVLGGRVLPFDAPAAHSYATLVAKARKHGLAIAPLDGQIAAIAKVHGFAVATRDTGPFEAAGVAVIDPWTL